VLWPRPLTHFDWSLPAPPDTLTMPAPPAIPEPEANTTLSVLRVVGKMFKGAEIRRVREARAKKRWRRQAAADPDNWVTRHDHDSDGNLVTYWFNTVSNVSTFTRPACLDVSDADPAAKHRVPASAVGATLTVQATRAFTSMLDKVEEDRRRARVARYRRVLLEARSAAAATAAAIAARDAAQLRARERVALADEFQTVLAQDLVGDGVVQGDRIAGLRRLDANLFGADCAAIEATAELKKAKKAFRRATNNLESSEPVGDEADAAVDAAAAAISDKQLRDGSTCLKWLCHAPALPAAALEVVHAAFQLIGLPWPTEQPAPGVTNADAQLTDKQVWVRARKTLNKHHQLLTTEYMVMSGLAPPPEVVEELSKCVITSHLPQLTLGRLTTCVWLSQTDLRWRRPLQLGRSEKACTRVGIASTLG